MDNRMVLPIKIQMLIVITYSCIIHTIKLAQKEQAIQQHLVSSNRPVSLLFLQAIISYNHNNKLSFSHFPNYKMKIFYLITTEVNKTQLERKGKTIIPKHI